MHSKLLVNQQNQILLVIYGIHQGSYTMKTNAETIKNFQWKELNTTVNAQGNVRNDNSVFRIFNIKFVSDEIEATVDTEHTPK